MQYGWKDYFTFTKKERRALLFLILFTGIISLLPKLFPAKPLQIVELPSNDSVLFNEVSNSNDHFESSNEPSVEIMSPHPFDPNTVDEMTMQKMHLRPKLIKTIINYRSKGGRFYQPDDLRKLFTITEEEADALVPFVRIHSQETNRFSTYPTNKTEKIIPIDHVIDINTADVELIKRLPGVSGSLAHKIVKYREIIGGFKSAEQLKKTYGMNDSIYSAMKPWITPLQSASVLININTASYKELLQKNVIPEHVAKAILIYREQHKGFKSVSELMNIPFISKDLYDKMAPSLTTQ